MREFITNTKVMKGTHVLFTGAGEKTGRAGPVALCYLRDFSRVKNQGL